MLRCHAFADAPNTSVVLCSRGGWCCVDGGQEEEEDEEEGEKGAGGRSNGRKGCPYNRGMDRTEKEEEKKQNCDENTLNMKNISVT